MNTSAKTPSLDDAKAAMDEYNKGYAAGGEPEFPQWAYDMLRAPKHDAVEIPSLAKISAMLSDAAEELIMFKKQAA